MRRVAGGLVLAAILVVAPATSGRADLITIDFENTPALPAGPSTFGSLPMQTITVPGIATISGGAVLGNPAGLVAFPAHGSGPNAYGTADFDANLAPTLAIDVAPSIAVTGFQGVLFNGRQVASTFLVDVFSGATMVTEITYSDIAPASSATAFTPFGYSQTPAVPITRVTIRPSDPANFDFFIDTVQLTFTPAAIPEPASLALLGVGGLAVASWTRRRRAGGAA
jgi:hypothetical protein